MDEAGPSIAVQMVGLNGVPTAGDDFAVCASEQEVEPHTSLSLQVPLILYTIIYKPNWASLPYSMAIGRI